MRRTAFSFAACLSALLCAIMLLIWAAFPDRHLAIEFQRPSGRWEVATDLGRVWLDNSPQVNREQRFGDRAGQVMEAAHNQVFRATDELAASRQEYESARRVGRDAPDSWTDSALRGQLSLRLKRTSSGYARPLEPSTSGR